MIKLIVSDVDGTLIPEGGNELDPHLFDYIRKLKTLGIRFTVASGRQYESILNVFRPVKEDVIFIADNGSFLIEKGQVLASNIFDGDTWKKIVRYVQRIPGASLMVSSQEGTFTSSTDGVFSSLMGDGYGVKMHYCPDLTGLDLHVSKVAVYDTEHDPAVLEQESRELFGDAAYIVASGVSWVDYVAPGAGKGEALKTLQNLLGITPQQTMAFGDNHNDISMLNNAAESYAVAGAPARVKEAAAYVMDGGPKEHAVLHILQKVVEQYDRNESGAITGGTEI